MQKRGSIGLRFFVSGVPDFTKTLAQKPPSRARENPFRISVSSTTCSALQICRCGCIVFFLKIFHLFLYANKPFSTMLISTNMCSIFFFFLGGGV